MSRLLLPLPAIRSQIANLMLLVLMVADNLPIFCLHLGNSARFLAHKLLRVGWILSRWDT